MARRVLDVFLSSTAMDLAAHRTAVHERLMRTGLFHCMRQEDFGAQDAGAVEFSCREAQRADLFVGLIGLRRGWEPGSDNAKRSITEMEHDWAKEAGRRRFLWVAPDDFPVPGNLRESDEQHSRQAAFRARLMGAGERIVSQKGFESPPLLASEIVEQLLVQVVTGDLLAAPRTGAARQGGGGSGEEQAPAVAAAVEKLSSDEDVDLLALAKNPEGVDVGQLEAKLRIRAEAHEALGERERKASAAYWLHIGAFVFLHDTRKALAAYEKAVALDPQHPEAWRGLGGIQYRLGKLDDARRAFERVLALGLASGDPRVQAIGRLRLGWIFADRGDVEKAAELFEEAQRLSKLSSWEEGVARACGNLGLIYFARGDLARAEELQREALKRFEAADLKEGMAATYGNLGNIYEARSDLTKAEEMHLKELKLNRALFRTHGIANALAGLGRIRFALGYFAEAEKLQLEALGLEEELGRKQAIARAYSNLGTIYEKTSKATRMCECWGKSRDLYREMGLADKVAEIEGRLRKAGCGED
jgi:tetratricopeptide (TPR) repeat protein